MPVAGESNLAFAKRLRQAAQVNWDEAKTLNGAEREQRLLSARRLGELAIDIAATPDIDYGRKEYDLL